MNEIAEHAGLAKATLTKVVDRMVAANLAYRRVDTVDRRRVLVYATVRGYEQHAVALSAVSAVDDDLERIVGASTLATLRTVLREAAPQLQ